MYFVVILRILTGMLGVLFTVLIGNCAQAQTVTYSSPYPNATSGYYLLHEQALTLQCSYSVDFVEITLLIQQSPESFIKLYRALVTGSGLENYFTHDRIENVSYEENSISITLTADKALDDNRKFRCGLAATTGIYADSVNIGYILMAPTSVTLTDFVSVIDGRQTTIECVVGSVYEGKDVTDFTVKVGDSLLTSGTKTQTSGSVTGTYDVTYTQTVTFTHSSHQGQQLQCEVVWMDGTSVETSQISEMKTLDIYFPATSVTLGISYTTVVEGSPVTFICITSSNPPSPRLRLYRQRERQSTSVVETVTGVTLSWTDSVESADNKADFYCGVDDNKNIEGWEFDVQSRRQELTVWFPPKVSVQSNSNRIEEDSSLVVTCDIEPGNPESITTQYWEFEPKYPGSESQALPEQRENRELRVERTVYTDAGTYSCTAGNTVGRDTGEVQVVVHYPPHLLNSDLTFYGGLSQQITLNISVRAFPEFSDLNSAFTWSRDGRSQITDGVTSRKLNPEEFYSELVISSVAREDYTDYTVTVDNGVKDPVSFTVKLQERGVPQAPRNVTVVAVAAQKANISWVVGLSGGSTLTFLVEFTAMDGKNKTMFQETNHVNPVYDSVQSFVLRELSPETEYQIVVKSMNLYIGGSDTDSYSTIFTTRALPTVNAEELLVEFQGSDAQLSWQYGVNDPEVTHVIIEQCTSEDICVEHNVTESTEKILTVPRSDGEIYYLVIYQDGLEGYKSPQFAVVIEPPPETKDTSPVVPVTVSIVVVAGLAAVIVGGVFYIRRKRNMQNQKGSGTESTESNPAPLYVNVGNDSTDYAELKAMDVNKTPPDYAKLQMTTKGQGLTANEHKKYLTNTSDPTNYEDINKIDVEDKQPEYQEVSVIDTQAGLGSNEIEIYEEIRKSRHVAVYHDEDLTIENLITKSRYSVLHKGILRVKGKQVAVMVKSAHEDIHVSESQFIFNQITCLEQMQSNQAIVESFSFGITGPMSFKVVMKYYDNGDLRQFLQKRSNMKDWQHYQNKESFLKELVLSTLRGLSYLERQHHEILHYQLSTEHVLVGDNNSCRLTGFGFKEHVLQREIKEEDEGIYGAIQWKAPEVIEDCKAHSKASDVWAFGILLHEIYTLGALPYEGMLEDDIKSFVKQGSTLEKPDGCPSNVFQIMQRCWAYNPEARPNFVSLLRKMEVPKKPNLGVAGKPLAGLSTYEDVSIK